MPKVSVIVPTYNRAALLKEAIESVLSQSYKDYEIIVIDDGTIDNTHQVVSEFRDNVKYVYQMNKGRSSARNYGIRLAQGEYIAFLDDDDLFLSNKLDLQVSALDGNPDFAMVYSHAYVIDEKGNLMSYGWKGNLSGWIYPQMLLIKNQSITTPAVMVRASVLKEVGGFDESMHICEDLDLWRRIARKYPVLVIRQPLIKIRERIGEEKDIMSSIKARDSYYQKAFMEDKKIGYIFKRRLYSEMFFFYGVSAISEGKRQLGRSLILKSFRYWPLMRNVMLLSIKCLAFVFNIITPKSFKSPIKGFYKEHFKKSR